ncbi:hypothetical protein EIN_311120, partial [Entamoeba invadens IP1]
MTNVTLIYSRDIYVDNTSGKDTNTGESKIFPFESLQKALSTLKDTPPYDPITIYVKSGYYPFINETLSITHNIPDPSVYHSLTVTKYPNESPPVITGGVKLPISSFRALDATKDEKQYSKIQSNVRSKIRVCDFNNQYNKIELGILEATNSVEIFVDEQRYHLARYPNSEYTDKTHSTDRIYVLPPTDNTTLLIPYIAGYYFPLKEVMCANYPLFKSEKLILGIHYYLYKNTTNYWTISSRYDCGIPTQKDGAYWTIKRDKIAGALNPIEFSGAHGKPILQDENYVYRGNMWTAYAPDRYGRTFYYSDSIIDKYAQYQEIWLRGYWLIFAHDQIVRGKVDNSTRKITVDRDFGKNPDFQGILSGRPFYIFNLLEELDEEGEYYIDYEDRKLFIYLKENAAKIWITQSTSNLIHVYNVTNVTIKNIIFEYARKDLVHFTLVNNSKITNCT